MKIFLTILLLHLYFFAHSATCTYTTTSGNWNTSSNWSCSRLPQAGDFIFIPVGTTVNVTATIDLSSGPATMISISGVLNFSTSNKLELAFGSGIQINTGGSLTGDNNDASQKIKIDGTQVWQAKCTGGLSAPACGNVSGPVTFGNSPLPVKLVSFYIIENNGENISLNWKTTEEENFSYFELQKSSDNKNWSYVNLIYPNPTGNYTYIDNKSYQRYYYRLKMVDNDLSYGYSHIVTYDEIDDQIHVSAVNGGIKVFSSSPQEVDIFNLLGVNVRESTVSAGESFIPLSSGLYQITANNKSLGKIVIE